MINYEFATLTRLDLEILDTQEKIKYVKLPTTIYKRRRGWTSITKK